MAQALSATAAQDAAERLYASARWHKRQASSHRRRAQEAMQALEHLQTECARLGISLVIRSQPGGTEHGRSDP